MRLQHKLHTWGERHESVRPSADRGPLETLVPHLLDIPPRDNPRRAGRGRRIEGQKILPRLPELKAHAVRVDDLDLPNSVLQRLGRHSAVAFEGELHVVGRHQLAVVETHALAQNELVREPVRGDAP